MTIHPKPSHLKRGPGRRLSRTYSAHGFPVTGQPILSDKDATAPLLRDAEVFS